MPDELAIDLQRVAKWYRRRVFALQDISMQVRRGEIFGLLGPNGAGKSTLVKIMMTVVRPTRAEGTVLGQPVGHKPTLGRIGYLPESHRFPRYLTGRQTLHFFAALAKVPRGEARKRADELLDLVGMRPWADQRVSTYSKGMMQRVGLALAMINRPDLILLDEPTDGVDPVGRRDIRDALLRLRQQGTTVFLNSHLLSELEAVCDRVAILVGGEVARQGTIDELTKDQQRYDIELALPDALAARAAVNEAIGRAGAAMSEKTAAVVVAAPVPGVPPAIAQYAVDAGALPNGVTIEASGPWIRIGTIDPAQVQPVLDALRASNIAIRRLTPIRQTLEDLFMQAVVDQQGKPRLPGAKIGGKP